MKRQMLLLICSGFLFSGCIGPKVNNCIFDFNEIERAIAGASEPLTHAEMIKLMREVKPWYCVPPDAKDATKDFHMALKTGQHGYSTEDWGILMHWITDHTK